MISVNDLKPGTTFRVQKEIYICINVDRNKTARGKMNVKVKTKNLRSGVINDISFTGGDKVPQAMIVKKSMQYLYDAGDNCVFMDMETYDQIEIPKEKLTWELKFISENSMVDISSYEEEMLGITLADKVNLRVIECEPAVKGDTATSASKNATVETGLQVKVPLFIKENELITISTSDGKYSGRAN
jgi:elongation factor P